MILWLCMLPTNAQTYYYKLNSYGANGTENTNVSGGQFITFRAALCMETDRTGVSIGTGSLMRKNEEPNIYVGTASWGYRTRFVFSSDKSTLKVYAPDNLIYRYTRTTAPSNAKTCSRLKSTPPPSNSSGGAAGAVGHPVQKAQKCGICYGTGKCTTCNGTGVSSYGSAHICGACGGTGRCSTCSGSGISGYITEYVY